MSDVWGQPAKGSSWIDMCDPQPWAVDALCAQIGGDIWHPEVGNSAAEAKRVCQSCPVQGACLQWAIDTEEPFGVLGGLSARERTRLKRGQPLTPCAVCGARFVARAPSGGRVRKYCSQECRHRAHRVAKRAYDDRRGPRTAA